MDVKEAFGEREGKLIPQAVTRAHEMNGTHEDARAGLVPAASNLDNVHPAREEGAIHHGAKYTPDPTIREAGGSRGRKSSC